MIKNLEERPIEKAFQAQHKEHTNLAQLAYTIAKEIKDQHSYELAGEALLRIKERRNRWRDFIDPLVKSAKEAHNQAVAKRREIDEPLRKAEEDILKPALSRWDMKQTEERKKKEQEMKDQVGFDVILPEQKRVDGITYRDHYVADITDKKALIKAIVEGRVPEEAVIPNMPLINNMAKSFKSGLNWPGVKVSHQKVVNVKPNPKLEGR